MLFSSTFLNKIQPLALAIARQRRGEDYLQPVDTLRTKFDAELQELAEATHVWDELPDVTYYAACLCLQGDDKYRLRASQPKDIEGERVAILVAVAQV